MILMSTETTTTTRIPRINEPAPDVQGKSTHGVIKLSDYTSKGEWGCNPGELAAWRSRDRSCSNYTGGCRKARRLEQRPRCKVLVLHEEEAREKARSRELKQRLLCTFVSFVICFPTEDTKAHLPIPYFCDLLNSCGCVWLVTRDP